MENKEWGTIPGLKIFIPEKSEDIISQEECESCEEYEKELKKRGWDKE